LLEVTPRTRKMVTREIRRLRPEVLVAPDPSLLWFNQGYINHWDHKQAGLLAPAPHELLTSTRRRTRCGWSRASC